MECEERKGLSNQTLGARWAGSVGRGKNKKKAKYSTAETMRGHVFLNN